MTGTLAGALEARKIPAYGGTLETEVEGDIAGFLKLGPSALPVTTTKRAIELRQLYVVKRLHGTGIARELSNWGIAEARRLGFEELYLTVFIDNHRARRFYAANGGRMLFSRPVPGMPPLVEARYRFRLPAEE